MTSPVLSLADSEGSAKWGLHGNSAYRRRRCRNARRTFLKTASRVCPQLLCCGATAALKRTIMTLPRRRFLQLAAGAAASGGAADRARAGVAHEAHPSDDPVHGRLDARHRRTHRARSAVERSSASRSWSRTAAARAAPSAPPPSPRAEPDGYTILINASAHSAAPAALSERALRHGARFLRRGLVRQRAQRGGDLAREGHQDAQGAGGRRQGPAR